MKLAVSDVTGILSSLQEFWIPDLPDMSSGWHPH